MCFLCCHMVTCVIYCYVCVRRGDSFTLVMENHFLVIDLMVPQYVCIFLCYVFTCRAQYAFALVFNVFLILFWLTSIHVLLLMG